MSVPDHATISPKQSDIGDFEQQFLEKLYRDIADNRFVLPSLPDVALKVRRAVDSQNATASKVANVIRVDAAMSARLLKVANSPLYRRAGASIEDLGTAVTRLGLSLVRTLIINLSIVQIMRPTQGRMAECLRALFEHSLNVAFWSYALAARQPRINTDDAMLAGMVHDIGYLPILQHVANHHNLAPDDPGLQGLLRRHHAEVGALVLERWNFGDRYVEVVRQHERIYRAGPAEPSLVDVVIAAELCAGHESGAAPARIEHVPVPAWRKLGLDPDATVHDQELLQLLNQARQVLSL